jgi:hypothetical protein
MQLPVDDSQRVEMFQGKNDFIQVETFKMEEICEIEVSKMKTENILTMSCLREKFPHVLNA